MAGATGMMGSEGNESATPGRHVRASHQERCSCAAQVEGLILVEMRILLAEDDETIRAYVAQGLREAGYAVDAVDSGESALASARGIEYDAVVLDVNLPGMSGFEVCSGIRARRVPGPPILFLTARDGIEDRVRGLDLGAEDYIVKPFAFAELLARIRALLRRGGGTPPILGVADLSLNPSTHEVARAGVPVRPTAKEFALLEYLMRNSGRVVTKSMIAEHVWDLELEAETNFIEVLVYALRKKIDAPFGTSLIQTMRGVGYRIAEPADDA